MKILECSSAGDKRFSALYAKVEVNGVLDTIESHYQKSKAFLKDNGDLYTVDNWKNAKGREPVAFCYQGRYYPRRLAAQYYKLLWYKYLLSNKSLIEVIMEYDDFSDKYNSKKAVVCQAKVIKEFKEDRKALYNSCKELCALMKGEQFVFIENDDILNSYTKIIGHQVNCQKVMGSGVAKAIRGKYGIVYDEYVNKCQSATSPNELLGELQIVTTMDKIVANMFGQLTYGRDCSVVYTDYAALEKAMTELKNYAKRFEMPIALPYKIGCGYANGDWKKVSNIIRKVFSDYYLILYKNEV